MIHIKKVNDFINEGQKNSYVLFNAHKPGEHKGGDWKGKNTKRTDIKFRLQIDGDTMHSQFFSVAVKNGVLDIKPGPTTTPLWQKDENGMYQTTSKKMTTSPADLKLMIKQIEDMYDL